MSFSPLANFLPKITRQPVLAQVATALAIEAGMKFLVGKNEALAKRVLLVSIKNGLVHAYATSAPAKVELMILKEPLFKAMKSASAVTLNDLRVELRGSLAHEA